jgi:NitT/TauT family transport system substrate-binding protein
MKHSGGNPKGPGRRACLAAAPGALLTPYAFAAAPAGLRLGVVQFGTVQWVADVIHRHGFDQAHGVALETVTLANNDAGRVALMGQAADIVVSDWFFVAGQRHAGTALSFVPFSSAGGGLMVPAGSPVRGIGDLAKRRLGVAGGPLDKSWLLFQAAARELAAINVADAAAVTYGAPPLLNAKLRQGELDAVLTFWNFAARLEAEGFRQVISVAGCARALGLPEQLSLIGFVFHDSWARDHEAAIEGFLAAAADADHLLARSDAEWQLVRPLMDAPDDALFASLRRRFVDGMAQLTPAEQQHAAARLFDILLRTGGTRATGEMDRLPEGIFWKSS